MTRFLKKSVLFIIPVFLAFGTSEFILQKIPNEYNTKIRNFEKKLPEIEVLILGSSHALRGINPHEFEGKSAYSMAMVSQPLQIDHDILFRYQDKMPNLKTVVISISHFSLSGEIDEGDIVHRLPFYHFFYGLDFYQLAPFNLEYHSLQAALGFKKSFNTVLRAIFDQKKIVKSDSLGWMGAWGVYCSDEKEFKNNAIEAVARHEDGSNDFSTNLLFLQNIIEWGKDNQVQILFVNTPKTVWYNDLQYKKKSRLIDSVMIGLTQDLKGIHYYDFKNHPSFDLDDFQNSDHLNAQGSEKLTAIISDILNDFS